MSVTAGDAFTKKAYCNGCFKVITWTAPTDEKDVMGNRCVVCPQCGANILVANAIVVPPAENSGTG